MYMCMLCALNTEYIPLGVGGGSLNPPPPHTDVAPITTFLTSCCRYLLLGTHQIPLRSFEGALVYLGEKDIDSDEVQCIVANLIEKVGAGCRPGLY